MKIIKVDLGERGYSIHIGNSILSDKKIFDKEIFLNFPNSIFIFL